MKKYTKLMDELVKALEEMLIVYGDHPQYDDSDEQLEAKAVNCARAVIIKAREAEMWDAVAVAKDASA